MFKFGTIGAFNVAKTNPRCKAEVDLVNGMVVVMDEANKLAKVPATDAIAKGKDLWVVNNIIDKYFIYQPSTSHKIEKGEYVRGFRLIDLAGLQVELDTQEVKTAYATLAKEDTLVLCDAVTDTTDAGKWKKAATTGYALALKIVEKTTYGNGEGLLCEVVAL